MELKGRTVLFLIDSIFFDTDCISAFLWVKNENLLEKMYSGKIIIPKEVYDELNKPSILHLKHRIDKLIARGSAKIMLMDIMTEEYDLYRKLTTISENIIWSEMLSKRRRIGSNSFTEFLKIKKSDNN